ncbi:pyridoxal phosphate-dependent aminotransferase [Actinoplanes sp. CA-054009]
MTRVPVSALGALSAGAAPGVVDLALGTPGFPEPPAEALGALSEGPHQYADMRGDPLLRARIAASFATPADPDTEVTVTVGASEALSTALLTLLEPGDEVVVVEPFYENFRTAIALARAVPRFVRTRAPHWRIEAEELAAAVGPRTRMLLLNTPANPTGHVLDEQEWALVAGLGVTVVCDEVYAGYVYDGRRHISAADVVEDHVVIGSLSKSHGLSGWRLGFLRAPAAVTTLLRAVHMGLTGGAAAPLQRAAARVSFDGDALPAMQARRDRVTTALHAAGLSGLPPEGGCYAFAGIPEDCSDFSKRLAAEAGVLVVPGRHFHRDNGVGSGFVRVAFNKSLADLDTAVDRLTAWAAGR